MSQGQSREVLLVGSLPMSPAASVFQCISKHLSAYTTRYPDGEQVGWLSGIFKRMATNPDLIATRKVPVLGSRASTQYFSNLQIQYYAIKDAASDWSLGPYGVAENAIASYKVFKEMQASGAIPAGVRFQATLPGPIDSAFFVEAPKAQLFRRAEEATRKELAQIVAGIPAEDLTIQFDLAPSVELIEYQRRPEAFDMPIYQGIDWSLDELAKSVANVADQVPAGVELGFHLCAIWHIDQSQGQDNNVHVDWCNALNRHIQRPIDYIHVPTVPEHDEEDFAPYRRLELPAQTKIFLGVIHTCDGLDGARRRMIAASSSIPEFGVAAFCGLKQPSREQAQRPHTVDELLELHRLVAELEAS